ncbi:MAG: hypothetical protein ACFBRM_00790 [Pikeienuella sp.]
MLKYLFSTVVLASTLASTSANATHLGDYQLGCSWRAVPTILLLRVEQLRQGRIYYGPGGVPYPRPDSGVLVYSGIMQNRLAKYLFTSDHEAVLRFVLDGVHYGVPTRFPGYLAGEPGVIRIHFDAADRSNTLVCRTAKRVR